MSTHAVALGAGYAKINKNLISQTVTQINDYLSMRGPEGYYKGAPRDGKHWLLPINVTDAHKYTYTKLFDTPSNRHLFLLNLIFISSSIAIICCLNFVSFHRNKAIEELNEYFVIAQFGANKMNMFIKVFLSVSNEFLNIVVLSALTFFISVSFIQSVTSSSFNYLDLALVFSGLLVGLILISLVSTFVSWLKVTTRYPSALLSIRNNAVTKGYGSLSLVFFQLLIISLLISLCITMFSQIHSLTSKQKGYSTNNIFVIWDNRNSATHRNLERVSRILTDSFGAQNVSLSGYVPGDNRDSAVSVRVANNNSLGDFEISNVGQIAFDIYDIETIAGRLFDPDRDESFVFPNSKPVPVIVNKMASEKLGFSTPNDAVGSTFDQRAGPKGEWVTAQIIGVIDNLNLRSAFVDIPPSIYYWNAANSDRILVRFSDEEKAYDEIVSVWTRVNGEEPDIDLLNLYLDELYEFENKQLALNTSLTFLALLLALLGFYNSLNKTLHEKRFEFGISILHGARFSQLYINFVSRVFFLILISAFFSVPIYLFLAKIWLEKFSVVYVSILGGLLGGQRSLLYESTRLY